MAFLRAQELINLQRLPLELKTMIVDEALDSAGIALASIRAVQMSLLQTSREFRAITQSSMATRTFWLQYILCPCLNSVAVDSNLTDFFPKQQPAYSRYARHRSTSVTLKVCACGIESYLHSFLVPYQPRAMIRTLHCLGRALQSPKSSSLKIIYHEVDSFTIPDCVQDAFELMSILIRNPVTTLNNCSDIVPSQFIGVPNQTDSFRVSDCYILQRMLEFAAESLASGRLLEVVDIFCIAQLELPAFGSRRTSIVTWKQHCTYKLMHLHLASCAMMALTTFLESSPEQIDAARYGPFSVREISEMARSMVRKYHYLDEVQRIEAIYDSAKLVYLLAEMDEPGRASLFAEKHEILQSLSDLRAAVAVRDYDPSKFLGQEFITETFCHRNEINMPEKTNLECREVPVLKIRGWMSLFDTWNCPAAKQLYRGLMTELERRI